MNKNDLKKFNEELDRIINEGVKANAGDDIWEGDEYVCFNRGDFAIKSEFADIRNCHNIEKQSFLDDRLNEMIADFIASDKFDISKNSIEYKNPIKTIYIHDSKPNNGYVCIDKKYEKYIKDFDLKGRDKYKGKPDYVYKMEIGLFKNGEIVGLLMPIVISDNMVRNAVTEAIEQSEFNFNYEL